MDCFFDCTCLVYTADVLESAKVEGISTILNAISESPGRYVLSLVSVLFSDTTTQTDRGNSYDIVKQIFDTGGSLQLFSGTPKTLVEHAGVQFIIDDLQNHV